MEFLQLILDQVEQYVGRELKEREKEHAKNMLKDDVKAIELFIASSAKRYARWLDDSSN